MGSVSGLGRSPRGGNGNPLQYSCLGNPTDRGDWWATVHEVTAAAAAAKSLQSCPTLCDPIDGSLPGSTHGQYRNQIDYILCSQRWRSSIQSAKTRPGADCGSDHELLMEKTTRPFKYHLNQIPYDYTMEVRNTFMGLDLIECLMNYGRRFMTLYRRQGARPS